MNDQEMLKLVADVGPHAKDALDSYMALQWANFWASCIGGVGEFLLPFLTIAALVFGFLWLVKKDSEKKETNK